MGLAVLAVWLVGVSLIGLPVGPPKSLLFLRGAAGILAGIGIFRRSGSAWWLASFCLVADLIRCANALVSACRLGMGNVVPAQDVPWFLLGNAAVALAGLAFFIYLFRPQVVAYFGIGKPKLSPWAYLGIEALAVEFSLILTLLFLP
jgi:hypothetical protein